jgi:hypothetical protein
MATRSEKAKELLEAHGKAVAALHKSLKDLQDPNDQKSQEGLSKLLASHNEAFEALNRDGPLYCLPHP